MPDLREGLLDRVKCSLLRHASNNGGAVTEQALSKHLKVSRASLREALSHLQKQGVIERRQKKGTYLRKPNLKELVDLWDVRCALEGMACRLACANVTPADVEKLRELCAIRVQAGEHGELSVVDQADIDFHEHIITISGNTCIRDIIRNTHLFDRIFRIAYTVPSYWPQDESQPYGHANIVDAIASRNGERAEKLIKRHIQEAKQRRIEALIGKLDALE
jgi:DNA-binding GntR family transcriptional regulator